MDIKELRIYGDNILECEKTLNLIYKSISKNSRPKPTLLKLEHNSNIYSPIYRIISPATKEVYKLQLFPGYGRWSSDILDKLISLGASLNEGTDSIVTQFNSNEESLLFGCEYCGALPAGNNVWQRSGRALLFAEAKIPFIYYCEIGGMELDEHRELISSRLPNALVPFSYFTCNINYSNSLITPVYIPSPSISEHNFSIYKDCFINGQDLDLIYSLLQNNNEACLKFHDIIQEKNLNLVSLSIKNAVRKDTISYESLINLNEFIKNNTTNSFFSSNAQMWKKKTSINKTDTLNTLLDYCKNNCISMGSKSLSFCLLPENKKSEFIKLLKSSYKNSSIINKLNNTSKPIALVWLAGYKKDGTDSRPDRGLLPLFRMLFGNEYTIVSVLFGAMKNNDISVLNSNPNKLINSNKLWKAIYTLSDFLVVDNFLYKTPSLGICKIFDTKSALPNNNTKTYSPCSLIPRLGEHDIDTVIHSIFKTTRQPFSLARNRSSIQPPVIFESFCNPPHGDWSGIEFLDIINSTIYRWTSLPRVSGKNKRPDHIIQFEDKILIIESKLHPKKLEKNIGSRLINYVQSLFNIAPICNKKYPNGKWVLSDSKTIDTNNYKYLSAVAFTKNSTILDSYSSNLVADNYSDYINTNYSDLFNQTNTDIIFDITIYSNIVFISIASKDANTKIWLENMIEYNSNIKFLTSQKKIFITVL